MAPKPPPYPADTRAKGWRFELDYERIDQADTWSIAAEVPMAQAALLMQWLMAWKQEPCGSLPNDEAIIRAKCRIPPAMWPKLRAVLMRGWWLADDGRLYHNTITKRVLEMLDYRRKTAERVAKHKAAKRDERAGNVLPTAAETVKNDTGTGTGTGTGSKDKTEHSPVPGDGGETIETGEVLDDITEGHAPTVYGLISREIRRAGISTANPGALAFRALVDAGATADEFTPYIPAALGKDRPWEYLLSTVAGERTRAAKLAGQLHKGPMPNKQQAIENRNRAVADEWAAQGDAA